MPSPPALRAVTLPRAVTVVGLGLIGGSLCRALRACVDGVRLVGIDSDAAVTGRALRDGVCDVTGMDEGLLDGADLVVLCTPLDAIPGWLRVCASRCPGALVSDCGSTKSRIVKAARSLEGLRFLGGHPMAGGERGGYAQSDADLFAGCVWVLTPESEAELEPFGPWCETLALIGARVEVMTPEDHDRAAAWASHLPLAVSSALVRAAAASPQWGRAQRITAGSFRDLARPAGSHARLLADIAITNGALLGTAIDGMLEELGTLRGLVHDGDRDKLLAYFERSRSARAGWLEQRVQGGSPVR